MTKPSSTSTSTAVIGDIHQDLAGLDTLLAGDVGECERVIVTGDFLDRGTGDPHEVIERLLALPNVVLLVGNHELAYLGGPNFRGVTEEAGWKVAPRLRDLVLDGKLRCAALVNETVCVHGGFSRAWLARYIAPDVGRSAREVVAHANRTLLRAVAKRTFTDPLFNALNHDVMGPFWASAKEDLLDGGSARFDQIVGHVAIPPDWHETPGGGRVLGVCRERADEHTGVSIGSYVLDE